MVSDLIVRAWNKFHGWADKPRGREHDALIHCAELAAKTAGMTLGERMHAAGYEVLIANVGDGYTAYLKEGGKREYAYMPAFIEEAGMKWVKI